MLDKTDAGRRVRLVSTSDTYTRLEPGTEGTVIFTDDFGTVFVDWDNGYTLGLIPGEDRFEFIRQQYLAPNGQPTNTFGTDMEEE